MGMKRKLEMTQIQPKKHTTSDDDLLNNVNQLGGLASAKNKSNKAAARNTMNNIMNNSINEKNKYIFDFSSQDFNKNGLREMTNSI